MTTGATGQMYGNGYIWDFVPGWQQNLKTVGMVQLGYMAQLFNSVNCFDLVPGQNHTVVTSGYGQPSSTTYPINDDYVTGRFSRWRFGSSYLPSGQTITVDLSTFSGVTTARWFDLTNNTFEAVSGSPFKQSWSGPDIAPRQ